MPVDLLAAFLTFAFVASVTPGPNNMLVLASGVNHGFRETIPHMLGIAIGFSVMLLAVGFGLGQLFTAFPVLYTVLKYLSVAYMLWLAWKIATAGPVTANDAATKSRPMTFLEGAVFQWINPKAWSICLTVVSAYTLPAYFASMMAVMATLFFVVNMACTAVWTGFGVKLRRMLADARRVRVFNVAMALLLLASLWPLLADASH